MHTNPDSSGLRPLLDRLATEVDTVFDHVRGLPVTPQVTVDALRSQVRAAFNLHAPQPVIEIFERASSILRDSGLHVTHPRYFGLFNPSVFPSTVVADALVALYNQQVGSWSHSPASNELERVALQYLATALGFAPDSISAHFTSGGNEANHTAVIAALAHTFPAWSEGGVRALQQRPTIYLSSESHHSFVKIARATGLGTSALRTVPADASLRMRGEALAEAIDRDTKAGDRPLIVVATTGTTSAGAVDPVPEIADVCERHGLWLHIDAAWGGTAALVSRLKPLLAGVERADSLTWDAHKGLSVPLGAGMFFTRHRNALASAFGVDTAYIPVTESGAVDLYKTSMQWSRRLIGLKVLFALAEHGSDGIAALVDGQARMGDFLRAALLKRGWRVVNDTPLPLVCFTHEKLGREASDTHAFVARVLERQQVWISDVALPGHGWVLRACITSYRSNESDVNVLMDELELALRH
jgi:glutamate/tyrosine decarboxylase-like PLP-dependent enzyme